MKIKICFTILLLGMMIFMLPLSFHATTEEDLLDLVFEKADFLEDFCGCAGFSLLNSDSYAQNIELLEHYIDGELFIESIYPAIEDFQDYEDYKQLILSHATPFLTMQLFSVYDKFFNINGRLYLQDTGAPYGEGGINFDTIDIIEEKDDYLTVLAIYHFSDDLIFETPIGLEKYSDSWRIDYIKWTIGIEPSLFNEEYIEQVFRNYICNAIRGYLLSENINCGYKKYSQNAEDLHSLDIVLTEYDLDTCTGSGYAVVDEYDKNGNVVGEHKITVEIGENLSETVTDKILWYDNPQSSDSDLGVYTGLVVISLSAVYLLMRKQKIK